MTEKQRKFWTSRALDREKRLIAYYKKNAGDEPDGSFVMNMFLAGWDAGVRAATKKHSATTKPTTISHKLQ